MDCQELNRQIYSKIKFQPIKCKLFFPPVIVYGRIRIVHHIYKSIFQIRAKKDCQSEKFDLIFFPSWTPRMGAVNIFMKSVHNEWHTQYSSWIWFSGACELYHESVNEIHKKPMNPWIWISQLPWILWIWIRKCTNHHEPLHESC